MGSGVDPQVDGVTWSIENRCELVPKWTKLKIGQHGVSDEPPWSRCEIETIRGQNSWSDISPKVAGENYPVGS